jgi:NDP-sugar pyrophosphorylase family protein
MLNILLLLAGQSSFFNKEDFFFPKPLIEINGKSMIQHVIENLNSIQGEKRFICVVNEEDCRKHHLDNVLKIVTEGRAEIIRVEGKSKGAACSALMAIEYINSNEPLLIANSDQFINYNLDDIVNYFEENQADAGVLCFETIHPRWSYVRFNEHHRIVEAAEKNPISKHAIAGFYYFAHGSDFVSGAMKSIQKESDVNGIYYVSTVLNELVLAQKKLIAFHLDSDRYHTFYSPQKIEEYQKVAGFSNFQKASVSHKISVVIPMAGLGKRFQDAGFENPKPFIDVAGKPMIERVLENLRLENAHYYLIARKEHVKTQKKLIQQLHDAFPVTLIELGDLTEGTACTVLYARHYIENESPLLIANSDQIIDINVKSFVRDCIARKLDGSILTFIDEERNPKWSFAKIDQNGLVTEVKEKKAISQHATVGIYLFSKGKDFVESAVDMIVHNDRVNNEFYTCPTYNYAIRKGKRIGIYNIEATAMHGIGTPEDLDRYIQEYLTCTASSR